MVEAMENVFRSTHLREMTSEERKQFRLPPNRNGNSPFREKSTRERLVQEK
jgi:hypothetical protein